MAQHNTESPLQREPLLLCFQGLQGGEQKRPWTKLQNNQGSSPQNITDHFCLLKKVISPPPSVFSFVIRSFSTYPMYLKGPGVNSRGGQGCQGLKPFSHGSQITTRRNSLLLLTTETQREMTIGSALQSRQSLTRPASSYLGAKFHTKGCLLISNLFANHGPERTPFSNYARERLQVTPGLSPGLYSAKSYLSKRKSVG